MSEHFILREVDIAQDAEKLAVMWQESDEQWPGTWSRGVEITPQMITEWHERERMINVYVFETQDRSKIVAYCGFNQPPGTRERRLRRSAQRGSSISRQEPGAAAASAMSRTLRRTGLSPFDSGHVVGQPEIGSTVQKDRLFLDARYVRVDAQLYS